MEDPLLATQLEDDPPRAVLIVMPDLFFRKRLRGQLEDAGYTVAEALSVQRALCRVESHPPDVVVLDTWTDGGKGVALLEAIRGSEDWRHIPVLLFGNDSRSYVREHAQRLGALGPVPIDGTGEVEQWVDQALSEGVPPGAQDPAASAAGSVPLYENRPAVRFTTT